MWPCGGALDLHPGHADRHSLPQRVPTAHWGRHPRDPVTLQASGHRQDHLDTCPARSHSWVEGCAPHSPSPAQRADSSAKVRVSSVFIETHLWGENQIIFLLRNCQCTSACRIVQDYQELLRNWSPARVPAKAGECPAQTSRAFGVVGHMAETGQGFPGGDPCSAQRAVEVLLPPPAVGRHSCSGARSRSGTVPATPARLLRECHQVAVMGPDGGMELVPSLGVVGGCARVSGR